ncbi:MAG: lamin tail domain-containing protein, partial [Phycisphaerales bacterium]|nr:lamin tail domain-containing protein [Phycisphaerales bacterium]
GDPLNGWPGSDGASSFFLVPGGTNYSLLGNNAGPNWRLSIAGLNGARQAAGIADAAQRPFALVNTGKDVGSPGFVPTTFQQPTGDVIITEIGATTNSIWPGSSRTPPTGQTVAGGQDEFVEILNRGTTPIDLTGWYLQDEDGRTQPFPAGTVLQPNQAAVIIGGDTAAPTGTNQPGLQPLTGRDFRQEFYNAWGCGYPVIVTTNWYTTSANSQFGLGRLADGPSYTNEILRIVRADGTPSDVVNYDDDGLPTAIAVDPFGWPADASTGILTFWSIYTLPGAYTQSANDIGLNWAASLTGFDGGRQSVINTAVDASNNPTGIFNASMFGSPGFVANVTGNVTNPGPACIPCRADFDNSGTRDVADIFAFLSAWFAGTPNADFNNSGVRDVADIFAFLSAWFAGCP